MTSEEAPQRLYIPQAFASGTGAALAQIGATSSTNINFVDGFPSAYEANTNPNGGKFVTRAEINAIGNLASVNEYARACGGIITFDPKLAAKIGGYPRGAVLECLKDLNYNRVISLVENNNYDFATNYQGYKTQTAYATGSYLTNTINNVDKCFLVTSNITAAENTNWSGIQNKVSELTGILPGEIDNEHWAYLGNGSIAYMETLCKIGSIGATPRQSHIPIGGFRAPRNGIPYFDGSFSFVEAEFPEGQTTTGSPSLQIYLLEGTSNPSSLNGASIAGGGEGASYSVTKIYDTFSNTPTSTAVLKAITAGLYYSVWASVSYGGIESHDFALKLS